MASFALEHLTFTYPGQTRPALSDLTLTIPEGAVTVLCGESGSGKSTLLRQLKTCLTPHGTVSGAVRLGDALLKGIPFAEQARRIGFVLQHPEGVPRAGVRAREPWVRGKNHAPVRRRDGELLRHCRLVRPRRGRALQRPEADAQPRVRRGHAAGRAHSGRADEPTRPHCGEHLSAHAAQAQRGAGADDPAVRAAAGGGCAAGRPPHRARAGAAAGRRRAAGGGGRSARPRDLFRHAHGGTHRRRPRRDGASAAHRARGQSVSGALCSAPDAGRGARARGHAPGADRARRLVSLRAGQRGRAAQFLAHAAPGRALRAHRQQRQRQDDGARRALRTAAAVPRQRVSRREEAARAPAPARRHRRRAAGSAHALRG